LTVNVQKKRFDGDTTLCRERGDAGGAVAHRLLRCNALVRGRRSLPAHWPGASGAARAADGSRDKMLRRSNMGRIYLAWARARIALNNSELTPWEGNLRYRNAFFGAARARARCGP
jgi:hypothetical protein